VPDCTAGSATGCGSGASGHPARRGRVRHSSRNIPHPPRHPARAGSVSEVRALC
jgi:hypothetical protein